MYVIQQIPSVLMLSTLLTDRLTGFCNYSASLLPSKYHRLLFYSSLIIRISHFPTPRCFTPEKHHNELLLSVDAKDFTCSHEPETQKGYSEVNIILDVLLLLMVLVVTGIILSVLWRRGFILCTPRKVVGRYFHVTAPPDSADLEWDDRDLNHIWTMPSASREKARRGT
jgi:cytochrome b subunit of formate dehydrogenase